MGKDAPGRRDRRVGIEDLARCREELSLSLSLPSPIFNRATLDVVLTPPPPRSSDRRLHSRAH